MNEPLQRILMLCGVPRWHQANIFGEATLDGSTLYVNDPDIAMFITRCYVDDFKARGVEVTVVVGKPPASAQPAPPAPTPGRAFKKSYYKTVYTGRHKAPEQGDML